MQAGILALLVVTVVDARRRLPGSFSSICGGGSGCSKRQRRELQMTNCSSDASMARDSGGRVGARRRNRSDDGPDPLADGVSVRRLGRVLHLHADSLPPGRQSEGQLPRREEPHGELHRVGGRGHRARADRRVRDSGLGRARRRVSSRRAKRPSFASSPSSSRGTCTIRAPTGSSAAPTSSSCRPTIRSASIAPIRRPRTTSTPSTSWRCRSTSRSSSICRARTSSTASASSRCA